MRRIIFFTILIIAFMVNLSYAKCPFVEYEISGKIKSANTGIPISGAQIIIFLDETETTSAKGYSTKYPDFFLTGADGRFNASAYFNSFEETSIFKGDVCSKMPTKVEVIIIKQGFKTKRKIIKSSGFKIVTEKDKMKINIPDINLEI